MSEWTDRVRNHPVWETMESLGPAVDKAAGQARIPANVTGIERVRSVLKFVGQRLAGTDPDLLHLAPLDGVTGAFRDASAELTAFVAEEDEAPVHVANANAHADTALTHLPGIPYAFSTDDWNALRDAGLAYKDSTEGWLKWIDECTDDYQQRLNAEEQRLKALTQSLDAEQAKLAAIAAEFQTQFLNGQEARSNQFTAAQEVRQQSFTKLQDEHAGLISELSSTYAKAREAAEKQYVDQLASLVSRFEKQATTILAKIQDHEKDVEKLVGVIGNLGVTSGYQKAANAAKMAMWMWQTIAVLSMITLAVIAFYAFLPSIQGSFHWESFAGRVFVSLTVGVLAAYAAAQADAQSKLERRNRKLALELEAIGPYLAPLPLEQQQEFRLRLGDRTFGQEDLPARVDQKSPATVVDVLFKSKEFRDLVTEAVKAAK